jgi:hypothetical protein
MKRIFFLIVTIVLIIVVLGIGEARSQVDKIPQPLMQPSHLTTTKTIESDGRKPSSNKECPTNMCPEQPAFNQRPPGAQQSVNQNPGSTQVIPPMNPPGGQQMPPPNISEGPQNVLIILDASYSMEEQIFGERKIDIAKRVVDRTVRSIPQGTRVGLRVYGHKIGLMGIYPCRKTELLVPMEFNTGQAIISKLRNIKPTGQTPITYSIKTAVQNDFNGLNGPKRIILVSDGMETCDGNPCEFAVDMVRKGIDFKIDVVGFALKDPAAINQLKCVALSTGGKFYTADTEAALAKSLQKSFQVKKSVEGRILFNK